MATVITGCKKESTKPKLEQEVCYECETRRAVDYRDGYASDDEITVRKFCNITQSRAVEIEREGTYKRQEQIRFSLYWVTAITKCKVK